ncbi:MAG: 50S ribosomal protein L3, partial [bacterium]|nr:50S ribosomal protein L3 [bacterium]
MTQIFDKEGNQVSVTVVEVGPCVVAQKKTKETDGYESLQIGFESIPEKKVGKKAKAYVGHFLKGNLKPFRYLREFRTAVDSFEVGQSLTVGSF